MLISDKSDRITLQSDPKSDKVVRSDLIPIKKFNKFYSTGKNMHPVLHAQQESC